MLDLENPMVSGYGFKDFLNYTPPVAYHCDDCGEPIHEGDSYLPAFGQRLCENCVDSGWQTAVCEEECMNFEEE